MIKNKRLIGFIAILAGLFMVAIFSNEVYKYFTTYFNGVKTEAIITGYKRINNNGSGQPAFEFATAENIKIKTICKTSLPKFMNKTSSRYFAEGEKVNIAYLPQNPTAAVIINWSTWLFNLLYIAVGLLFAIIGVNMLFKK